VDREQRWASNNFFLVIPKQPCSLDLDGLCALLNSRFMTWYFRVIEPRQGRAFAELKIKHLSVFPLPGGATATRLNELGRQRCDDASLDSAIDETVRELFGVREDC
jgi:TaqI-like C-terminal specificity domain